MMTIVVPETDSGRWRLDDVEAAYRTHRTHLVRLATLAVGDGARAEDIVQDVFAAVHRKPPELADETKVGPYLRGAVLNRCRSNLGRRATGDRVVRLLAVRPQPVPAGPEQVAADDDARDRVLRAVRRLPRRQRDVVLLRYYAELSEAEIAASLGIAPGTVKSAAHRAMATLAPLLEDLR